MDEKIERYIENKCAKLDRIEKDFRSLENSLCQVSIPQSVFALYEKINEALAKKPQQKYFRPAETSKLSQSILLNRSRNASPRIAPRITETTMNLKRPLELRRPSAIRVNPMSQKTVYLPIKETKTLIHEEAKTVAKPQPYKQKSDLPLPIISKPGFESRISFKPNKILSQQTMRFPVRAHNSQIFNRSQNMSKSEIGNNDLLSVNKPINDSANESKREADENHALARDISIAPNQEWQALKDLQLEIPKDDIPVEIEPTPEKEIMDDQQLLPVSPEVLTVSVPVEEPQLEEKVKIEEDESTLGLFECKYEEIVQNFNSEIVIEVDYENYDENKTLDDHDKMFLFEFLEISKNSHTDVFDCNTEIFEQNTLTMVLKSTVSFLPAGRTFNSNHNCLAFQANQRHGVIQMQIDNIDSHKNTYIKVKLSAIRND
jgi:hypothetical protein